VEVVDRVRGPCNPLSPMLGWLAREFYHHLRRRFSPLPPFFRGYADKAKIYTYQCFIALRWLFLYKLKMA
jgi:hypothetical protein